VGQMDAPVKRRALVGFAAAAVLGTALGIFENEVYPLGNWALLVVAVFCFFATAYLVSGYPPKQD
jgi:uncharacterized membrane protein